MKTGVIHDPVTLAEARQTRLRSFPKQQTNVFWDADDRGIQERHVYSTEPDKARIRLVRIAVDKFPTRRLALDKALLLAARLYNTTELHMSFTTARWYVFSFVVPLESK